MYINAGCFDQCQRFPFEYLECRSTDEGLIWNQLPLYLKDGAHPIVVLACDMAGRRIATEGDCNALSGQVDDFALVPTGGEFSFDSGLAW